MELKRRTPATRARDVTLEDDSGGDLKWWLHDTEIFTSLVLSLGFRTLHPQETNISILAFVSRQSRAIRTLSCVIVLLPDGKVVARVGTLHLRARRFRSSLMVFVST